VPVLHGLVGHRRAWMLVCQAVIILGLLAISTVNPAANLPLMAAIAVIVGFATATQDIVIDAWRIEVVDTDRQGQMAVAVQWGYRGAMIMAGAVPLLLAERFGWNISYLAMAGAMVDRRDLDPAGPARGGPRHPADPHRRRQPAQGLGDRSSGCAPGDPAGRRPAGRLGPVGRRQPAVQGRRRRRPGRSLEGQAQRRLAAVGRRAGRPGGDRRRRLADPQGPRPSPASICRRRSTRR
jgi:hypothetical protein